MEVVNNTINHIQNLPKIKKILLVIMVVVIILFILEIVNTSYKQKYTNIANPPKKISKKIEKMDTQPSNNSSNNNSELVFGDLTLDPSKTNVTLYFAEWCGHCKQFMSTTWNKATEHFGGYDNIKLNKVDCTETKSEIKTPAGKTIQGFPTVIINYKNADGEYIEEEYNGGRSFEVFSAYLEKLNSGA